MPLPVPAPAVQGVTEKIPTIPYESFSSNEESESEKWYMSSAARNNGATRSGESAGAGKSNYRENTTFKYSQINNLPLPYNYDSEGGVDITDAVELVHKCYANVGIAKNSVDIMAETANTPHYLEGGTDKSRRFTELWLKKIDINHMKEQFYSECFRSGNVFFYKLTGKWSGRSFAEKYSDNISIASPSKLALKYILLNPAEIVRTNAVISDYIFTQRYSPYELNKLNNPQTDREKEIYKAIKDKAQNLDLKGVMLEDRDICFSFYNKQDYEPFALPFLWPALGDINLKLEMKKRDQQVLRTINNVILLITNGAEPDKGGVNKENILALQRIFQQEACGKTLVADYTTKGEHLIPDLKKALYPEKYAIINEDIKEALANILFGTDAKYGNLVVKVQVFLKKMQKAREAFEKMMQREIEIACEYMGITNPPTIKTDKESLEDPALIQKTAIRLLELGVITPQEAVPLLKNREFPDVEAFEKHQKEYLEKREDGLYMPLVGGQPLYDNGIGAAKTGAPSSTGRPKTKAMASTINDWKASLSAKNTLISKIEAFASNGGSLAEEQKKVCVEIANKIFRSEDASNWDSAIKAVFENPEKVDEMTAKTEIIELSMTDGLTLDDAALWYYAQKNYEKEISQS